MSIMSTIIHSKVLNYAKYAKIAYKQDKKNKEYLEKSTIFNKYTGEIKHIEYNKEWYLRQSYLFNTFKIDYLNEECINKGMIPIFITLTLPSEYHPLRYKGTQRNPNYDENLNVFDGYEKLNSMFRDIYDSFRVNRKRVKGLKFIRVIEPHKDWTPHLHSIVYVDAEYKDKFLNHVRRVIQKNKLEQTDIKELDAESHAVTYLLKYVDKTLSGDDSYRGWRMHHKIHRVITMSNLNIGLTRNIFKRVSQFIPFDKDNKDIYFKQILDQLFITRIQKDSEGNIIKMARYGDPDSPISVLEITKKYQRGVVKEFFDDEGFYGGYYLDYDYEVDYNMEFETAYKLEDLIVYDKDFNELYNKRDTIFCSGFEYSDIDTKGLSIEDLKEPLLYIQDDNFIDISIV